MSIIGEDCCRCVFVKSEQKMYRVILEFALTINVCLLSLKASQAKSLRGSAQPERIVTGDG